ncbi:uncharacterized protein LOC122666066 [Telopea speciosissima]|uniref:uncharacterized protein LOC122666066 n=1 Tax=Telopea speciosissima TaxID=54955 RepID=UPI001CC6811D|nr:uncharacterized protein LOC122666066 [Telopea speciosissima]
MGNCLETCRIGQQKQEEKKEQQQQQQQRHDEAERKGRDGFIKEGGGGLRVKIVLTKEELEWLMFQLKEKRGKNLEDLLEDLEKWRGRTEAWKPSLECIMESPEEVHDMNR